VNTSGFSRTLDLSCPPAVAGAPCDSLIRPEAHAIEPPRVALACRRED
jgi:hypothetical protein